MDVAVGRIVYTMFLNERGGIEADLTVTRLSRDRLSAVVPGATLQRNLAWLRAHVGDDFAVITDVTAAESVLCVMGPKARDLMAAGLARTTSAMPPIPLARRGKSRSAWASPARTASPMSANWGGSFTSAPTRPPMSSRRWRRPGADLGLKLCGLHTLDSCRIEKAYRHWGHDITDEDHVLEAGLGFAVSRKKPAFIGPRRGAAQGGGRA